MPSKIYIPPRPNSFGSIMEGRSYEGDTSLGYRFGFNGKERDDETYGGGNEMDFGDRVYNTRSGRWFSLDPLQAKYQSLSPYNYCANDPIYYIDCKGRENVLYIAFLTNANNGKPVYTAADQQEIIVKAQKILSDQGINVKVIGVESDHRFNIGFLDKTDDVVYIGNTTQINNLLPKLTKPATNKKGDLGLALGGEQGYTNQESYANTDDINTSFVSMEFSNKNLKNLESKNGENFDNEGIAAITVIHESLGHNITDNHRNQWSHDDDDVTVDNRPNILAKGVEMLNVESVRFAFDLNLDYLRFLPEDLSKINAKYSSPITLLYSYPKQNESRGAPTTDPKYYHDSYSKADKSINKINE